MVALPLLQKQVIGQHFADVVVETGLTASEQHNFLNETLKFKISDWAKFLIFHRLPFSKSSYKQSLWLLSPVEVGIEKATDFTTHRQWDEEDLFVPTFYRAAKAEGFQPCLPDVLSTVAELFAHCGVKQLRIAHAPVRDSGGGDMVLTLNHRTNGLTVSDLRYHYSIQHLLSCETPWLFCRQAAD